jgi:anti-sigma B factor antagonist
MRIEVKEEFPGGVVLSIQGDLVGGPHAEDFYATIRRLIEEGRKDVLIDLGQAKHANSSGLGILIRGYVSLKNAGGSLRVFNLSKNVDHMFKVTRFNSIIEAFGSEEEARAGLR